MIKNTHWLFGFANKTLPTPFEKINRVTMGSSKYTKLPNNQAGNWDEGRSTVIPGLLAAIQVWISLNKGVKSGIPTDGGIGQNGALCLAEYLPAGQSRTTGVVYNPENGEFMAVMKDIVSGVHEPALGGPGNDGTVIWLSLLPTILGDEEAASMLVKFDAALSSGDLTTAIRAAGVMSDNAYRRILQGAIKVELSADASPLPRITELRLANGSMNVKQVLCGDFFIFPRGIGSTASSAPVSVKIKEGEFNVTHHSLTADEQALVWPLPGTHAVSLCEQRCAKVIHRNWERPESRVVNLLLEGDAGSGKTELAKALSHHLGLPYTKVTCSTNMDEHSLVGQFLPVVKTIDTAGIPEDDLRLLRAMDDAEGITAGRIRSLCGIPTPEEIFFAPEAAYARICGVTKDKVDPVCALDAAERKIEEIQARLISILISKKEEGVSYRFYPSEVVKALKYGWIVEIQEPACIIDAGVLSILNSAMEPDGMLNLPTENVPRHHDAIVILTTNRNYEGCRPLNEAMRDRVQHCEKMGLPSVDEMCLRTLTKLRLDPKEMPRLKEMATAIKVLNDIVKTAGIKGVAGMRSMNQWADAVIIGGDDIVSALMNCVIYKITTDDEEVDLLYDGLKNDTELPL